MRRTIFLIPLAVLVLATPWASSDERNRFADVLALQEAVHQSIQRAEPSIACILVSRSEKYRALEGVGPHAPGQLGRLDLGHVRPSRDDPQSEALARLDLSNPENVPEDYGSGVVINEKEGLVLTLAHVVRNATKIYVRLPADPEQRDAGPTRRGSWADIHALDSRSDLAVLRLIEPVPNLKALKVGDGSKLRKGDFVLSLSNPFAAGFRDGSPSASWGIVSNLRRRATGTLTDIPSTEQRNAKLPLYCFNTLIQTDTRLNLGCSGGALLNLQGELIGLTSSLAGIAGGETPGGFAVPLDAGMRRILEVLRRGEEVEYGFLGVYLKRPEEVPQGAVRISGLIPGGPAAQGGIRGAPFRVRDFQNSGAENGDYILSINGTPIHSNDDLFLAVGMQLAGNTVRVEVSDKPDGPQRLCRVTLAKFPSLDPVIASKRPTARGGLRVDWTSIVLPRLRLRRGIPEGVLIREVLPGSAAAHAGLQPDMIIKSVNRKKVTNPTEFYQEMEKAHGPVELGFSSQDEEKVDRVTINIK